jgi:hypothetical protein
VPVDGHRQDVRVATNLNVVRLGDVGHRDRRYGNCPCAARQFGRTDETTRGRKIRRRFVFELY